MPLGAAARSVHRLSARLRTVRFMGEHPVRSVGVTLDDVRNVALTLPRTYIYATRITPADTFGPFARQPKNDPAWNYYEIDASHSPNVTAPDALMAMLEKIAAEPKR